LDAEAAQQPQVAQNFMFTLGPGQVPVCIRAVLAWLEKTRVVCRPQGNRQWIAEDTAAVQLQGQVESFRVRGLKKGRQLAQARLLFRQTWKAGKFEEIVDIASIAGGKVLRPRKPDQRDAGLRRRSA
jgi:hypothetical protein